MNPGILFVDDEPRVLSGLRRMLMGQARDWDMRFVTSGREALEFLAGNRVDVLVTDIRMPGMDGVELLNKVRELHPGVARIVLSGYMDQQVVSLAALSAHQFLSKPCEPGELLEVIRKTLQAMDILGDANLRAVVARVESLPSLPRIYRQVVEEMRSESPSLGRVGQLVASDPGMSAGILKMVNSSFFGFCRKISSPEQAATLLGLNTIRSLILSVHVFTSFDLGKVRLFSINRLWEHSLRASRLSCKIAAAEGCGRDACDDALASGLLHDVGKLALATQMPKDYDLVLEAVRRGGLRVEAAEIEHFGVSHARVGAYLLCLWGLPEAVVSAVCGHHAPSGDAAGFPPVFAVYVGNIMDHRHYILNKGYAQPELDRALLAKAGLDHRAQVWENITMEEIVAEENDEPQG